VTASISSLLDAPRASSRPHQVGSLVAFALFLLLLVLVQLRALVGIDLAATHVMRAVAGDLLDTLAGAVSLVLAFELSVLYGGLAAVMLWRSGLGRWSLAPLAFVLLTVLEVALKLTIYQPGVPGEFLRAGDHPLISLILPGSFPSGHALRSAFFTVFLAVLLFRQDSAGARVGSVALVLLGCLLGLSRVYLGMHWLSDVIAGLLLGAGLALVVAPPVAARWSSIHLGRPAALAPSVPEPRAPNKL